MGNLYIAKTSPSVRDCRCHAQGRREEHGNKAYGQAWNILVLQLFLKMWLTTPERCSKSGGNCGLVLGEIAPPLSLCFLPEYFFSTWKMQRMGWVVHCAFLCFCTSTCVYGMVYIEISWFLDLLRELSSIRSVCCLKWSTAILCSVLTTRRGGGEMPDRRQLNHVHHAGFSMLWKKCENWSWWHWGIFWWPILLPFFFSFFLFFFFFQKGKKWSRTLCGTSFLQVMEDKVQEPLVLISALEVWVLTERRLEKYSV